MSAIGRVQFIVGDCVETLKTLPACAVHTCVTSPPYFGLRDYGVDGQLGLEPTPAAFVEALVAVMRQVRRVLRDDGTLWLNLGDSYSSGGRTTHVAQSLRGATMRSEAGDAASGKQKYLNGTAMRPPPVAGVGPKQMLGIPWRVALALQEDGWCLRQDIIWHKPNPMPESIKDRCTKAHEYIFLLSKSPRYYFDHEAIKEPATGAAPGNKKHRRVDKSADDSKFRTSAGLLKIGGVQTRHKRSVWSVPPAPFRGAHFATFPPALIEPCILAGAPAGGTVLDPFGGAGTTAIVANKLGRNAILCELNSAYVDMARERRHKELSRA